MKNSFKLYPVQLMSFALNCEEIRALIGRVFILNAMRKLLTLAITTVIILTSCSKDYSHSGNCGRVLQKIHDSREPIGNEIWALAVSVTNSTERFVGVDSVTWNKINIGDKYCDK